MPRGKTKPELKNELAKVSGELAALRETLKGRFYKLDGKPALTFPLTREQLAALGDFPGSQVSSLAGEGRFLADLSTDETHVFDLATGWSYDNLLPEFDGLLIRYSYNREDGSAVWIVWGLKIIAN